MARELILTLLCIKFSEELCGQPGTPMYGQMNYIKNNYETGHIINYTCLKGFVLSNNVGIECLESGQWRKEVPVCGSFMQFNEAKVEDPKRGIRLATRAIDRNLLTEEEIWQSGSHLPNATFIMAEVHNFIQVVLFLTVRDLTEELLRILCQFKPELTGTKMIISLGNSRIRSWKLYEVNAYGYNSAAFCGSPPIPQNTLAFFNVSTNEVTYQCNSGYTDSGLMPKKVTCTWGRWSVAQINCEQIHCPPFIKLPHGRIIPIIYNASVGSVIHFVCSSGYKLRGVESLVCEDNGVWSGDYPFCEAIVTNTDTNTMQKMEYGLSLPEVIGITIAVVVILACIVTATVFYRHLKRKKLKSASENVYQDVDTIYSRHSDNSDTFRHDNRVSSDADQPAPEYTYISIDSGAFDCTNAQSSASYIAQRENENYEAVPPSNSNSNSVENVAENPIYEDETKV